MNKGILHEEISLVEKFQKVAAKQQNIVAWFKLQKYKSFLYELKNKTEKN